MKEIENIGFVYLKVPCEIDLEEFKIDDYYQILLTEEIRNIAKVSEQRAERIRFLEKHLFKLLHYFIDEDRDKSFL